MINLTTNNDGFMKLFPGQKNEASRFPPGSITGSNTGSGSNSAVIRQSSATTGAGYNSNIMSVGGKLSTTSGRPQTGFLSNSSTSGNGNGNFNFPSGNNNNSSNTIMIRKSLDSATNNSSSNNSSLSTKMEELTISGDKKSLHSKDINCESPRRVLRKSYSSSSIEKPKVTSDADNTQNFDPNVIRNFDHLFEDCANTQQPKSPVSNPRSSFAGDQRKRMFVAKRNLSSDSNNASSVNSSSSSASSSYIISSNNVFPDINAADDDSDMNNRNLCQVIATLKSNLAQVNQKYILEQEDVKKLKAENENLHFYKKNLHVFIEEASSFKFLNAVQEQKIQDLENQISKIRMEHNEKISEKVRKYKSEASRLKNEKFEFETKANENVRQMTEQMSKLQSFAMKRIELLEKELIEERHTSSDLKSDLLATKSNNNYLRSLHSKSNRDGFSSDEPSQVHDDTSPASTNSSNSSTPEKKAKKINKKTRTSMSDDVDSEDISKTVEIYSASKNESPTITNIIKEESEQSLQMKTQLGDELAAMWMPSTTGTSTSNITSPTSPKKELNRNNPSRKNRRKSSNFSQSQVLKVDSEGSECYEFNDSILNGSPGDSSPNNHSNNSINKYNDIGETFLSETLEFTEGFNITSEES